MAAKDKTVGILFERVAVRACVLAADKGRIFLFPLSSVSNDFAGGVLSFNVAVPKESAPGSAHDPVFVFALQSLVNLIYRTPNAHR